VDFDLSLNVVIIDKPNVLTGLSQNGARQGLASVCWVSMDIAPPADRRGPSRSEIHAEQDKPVVLPATAGEPQGTLLALRVRDCGKSERLPVMGRIPAAAWSDAKAGRLPRGHSWRENLINRYTREGR
jgi:RNA-directed DNA polymerase